MKIVINGKPIPKARARLQRRGNHIFSYDPQHAIKKKVKKHFTLELRKALSSENKEIELEASNLTSGKSFHLSIHFYLPLNESDTNAQKNAKLWGFEPCNKKPDCSNMLKFYEDAANEVLFPDDSMITSGDFEKSYDEKPRTEINIMPKEDLNLSENVKGILKIFSPQLAMEFLDDVAKFNNFRLCLHTKIDPKDKEDWLESLAMRLSNFSMKYADHLKKIKKFEIEEKKE